MALPICLGIPASDSGVVHPGSSLMVTEHNCINLRLPIHGLYPWDLEKGKRKGNVRVDGQLIFNSTYKMLNAALAGLGLAYVPEGLAQPHIAKGHLR